MEVQKAIWLWEEGIAGASGLSWEGTSLSFSRNNEVISSLLEPGGGRE